MTGYPTRPLAQVLKRSKESVDVSPELTYKQVTVRLFHKGVVLRGVQEGSAIRTTRQWRIRSGQVLLSRIDARNGAIGLVPPELDGAIVTNDFWAFDVQTALADPQFLDFYFGAAPFVEACQVASEGTTNRVRLQPDRFLQIEVPLPTLSEQRRIVRRVNELQSKLARAAGRLRKATELSQQLLLALYARIVRDAENLHMSEVAPLVRRPVQVDPAREYYELGIRSFGRGTFHKAPVSGINLGSKRIFAIQPGDLLFNIVFAWEGAVAIAKEEDEGRVGSHRFLTCVPNPQLATSSFLRFHFLTEQGLRQLGEASPGGAGRNRTLGLKALQQIQVPVPSLEQQQGFDSIVEKMDVVSKIREEATVEIEALTPAFLSRVFGGKL